MVPGPQENDASYGNEDDNSGEVKGKSQAARLSLR